MNNLFAFLTCFGLLISPHNFHTINAYPVSQSDEKPKKEILISIRSNYYKDANSVIEAVFKQANILDFSIDEKVKEIKSKNIQFKNKTLMQTFEILSKFYNIKFEITEIGKDKFYAVTVK